MTPIAPAPAPPRHLGIRCDHWLEIMDELNIGAFVADGRILGGQRQGAEEEKDRYAQESRHASFHGLNLA